MNAKRRKTGGAAEYSLKPIADLAHAMLTIESLTAQASSPPVEGVVHVPVKFESKSGFIKTFVPESVRPPHMAKLGEDRYYTRSGDSFLPMENFQVADMFGRRARPDLRFRARVAGAGKEEGRVIVAIENSGRALARFPLLEFEVGPPEF